MWMSGGSPSMPGMLEHLPCGRAGRGREEEDEVKQ